MSFLSVYDYVFECCLYILGRSTCNQCRRYGLLLQME